MNKRHIAAALIVLLGLMALIPGLVLAPSATVAKSAIVESNMQNLHDAQLSGDSEELLPKEPSRNTLQLTPGLHVQGVTLVNADGSRFVAAGINMEMYRDYDHGCGWVTDGTYAVRGIMADKVKALGVNAVRLNYSYRFLDTANLTRFLDMAQELANRGIYVMPSDHTYTGNTLINASAAYPMMFKIIEGMRARGLESYLIMNPFNEPGPDITAADWIKAQKSVLIHLRTVSGFKGVVALDGTGWSTLLDVAAFKEVQAFDATINGGVANLVFSNHVYPNIRELPAKIWSASSQIPLVIGELGQENPGASPLDPAYVKNVIGGALNTGIPAGHNGLFAWIFQWCDTNKMLQDWTDSSVPYSGASPLTSYGTLWRDNYYAKLPAGTVATPIPPPATIIVQLPTATRTPTRTILPTNTPRPRTPTRTPTDPPVVIITNTPAPSTPPCDAVLESTVSYNGKQAVSTTCIRIIK